MPEFLYTSAPVAYPDFNYVRGIQYPEEVLARRRRAARPRGARVANIGNNYFGCRVAGAWTFCVNCPDHMAFNDKACPQQKTLENEDEN